MKEIIGAILGLAGGFVPELIKLFKDKQDKKHELAVMKLQIEQATILHGQKLEEIAAEGQIQADLKAYDYAPVFQPEPKGKLESVIMTLVYAFNSLVRPIITYAFVGLYGWIKYAQFKLISATSSNVFEAVVRIWTDTDAGFVAMVIMFWFGGRQMTKTFGKK